MLIKRCKIDGITIDIKVEDKISTKEEQTLVLINLLKILAEGHIESLINNNASKDEIDNYKETLKLINMQLNTRFEKKEQ